MASLLEEFEIHDLSAPLFSASSIIFSAIRSFIELPGLVVSILAKTVAGISLVIVFSFTIGVLPMVSSILLYHILVD